MKTFPTAPECDLEMISVITTGQAGDGPVSSRDCNSESNVLPTAPSIGTQSRVTSCGSPDLGSCIPWVVLRWLVSTGYLSKHHENMNKWTSNCDLYALNQPFYVWILNKLLDKKRIGPWNIHSRVTGQIWEEKMKPQHLQKCPWAASRPWSHILFFCSLHLLKYEWCFINAANRPHLPVGPGEIGAGCRYLEHLMIQWKTTARSNVIALLTIPTFLLFS